MRVAPWREDLVMSESATYRCLAPVPLPPGMGAGAFAPGTTLTEGQNIPEGWQPTPAVDPLNAPALAAFYAIRPEVPPVARQLDPQTYWQVRHYETRNEWSLTGPGSGLPAINM
jgi:hypothetical protein